MKCGNLNFLEPSGPVQACNRTALPFFIILSHISVSLESPDHLIIWTSNETLWSFDERPGFINAGVRRLDHETGCTSLCFTRWDDSYDVHDVHGDYRVACHSDIYNTGLLIVAITRKILKLKLTASNSTVSWSFWFEPSVLNKSVSSVEVWSAQNNERNSLEKWQEP